MPLSPVPLVTARAVRRHALVVALPAVVAALATGTALAAPVPGRSITTVTGAAPTAVAPGRPATYVVTLSAPPVASYAGGVRGLAATRPAAGGRLDARSSATALYRRHVTDLQDDVLGSVGARALARYSVTLNGAAARLTSDQAARLARDPRVASVTRDRVVRGSTTQTPDLLGLTGKGGAWGAVGGARAAGRGVVVGVIDSGVWPESPSFRGSKVTSRTATGPGRPYRTSSGAIAVPRADGGLFVGDCQAGESFSADLCNSKLVSARWYGAGWFDTVGGRSGLVPGEYASPRGGYSHGSHVAGTAVGNQVRNVRAGGENYGNASGMAPGASLAVYKALWGASELSQEGVAGTLSDILAAMDQAVADGVDVLNLSFEDGSDRADDPVEIATLNAASAGVFVAAAAGNDGDGGNEAGRVDHQGPWVTTVGAAEVKDVDATVRLGDGTELKGRGLNRRTLPATAAVLGDAAAAPRTDDGPSPCGEGGLDPAKARGRIVVCDAQESLRTATAEVARVGGRALVYVAFGELDDDGPRITADVHPVRVVQVPESTLAVLTRYLRTAGPTLSLRAGAPTGRQTLLPRVATFSSRGPAEGVGGDVLKPDLVAPGVAILAAATPARSGGDGWTAIDGTSMATPHVAGFAAVLAARYPSWTPARIKSALMTTAVETRSVKDAKGRPSRDPLGQGAGLIDGRRVLDPGLVYDTTPREWLGFLEGLGVRTGSGAKAIEPSDLNQPSIAIGRLPGRQTVTRRVTALRPGTWTAAVSVPGFRAQVTPSRLTFTRAGQVKAFRVTLTRTTAAQDRYTGGSLTWRGPAARGTTAPSLVRSPVSVRPVLVDPPARVQAAVGAGSATWTVQLGGSRVGPVTVQGLAPGEVRTGTLTPGPATYEGQADPHNLAVPLEIPRGTSLLRIDLTGAAADDLDLYLNELGPGPDGPELNRLADSATSGPDEVIEIADPPAGTYSVQVNAFSSPNPSSPYTVRTFLLGSATTRNATVTPTTLTGAATTRATVRLRWSGLEAGRPYLGRVRYGRSILPTTVLLDAPAGGTDR